MIKSLLLISIILCGIGVIILGIQLKDYKYPSQIQKEFTKEFNKEWEQIKMTEKRFTIKPLMFIKEQRNGVFEIGKHNGDTDKLTIKEIVDLLNSLNDENEQLKQQLKSKERLIRAYEQFINDLKEDGVLDD